jgi:response regulator RpfG family c-di-GMP phosphodiesterase
MTAPHDRNLEALIYSDDQWISARCAEAFAELPVDWVRTEDSNMASKLLSNSSFDFVILDLDSPSGTALLPQVRTDSSDRRHAVVLGITGGGIDADILEMSYESLIFYPVRPEQICSEVHRAMPLAERVSKHIHLPSESSENAEDLETSGPTLFDGLRSVARMVATKAAEQFRQFVAYLLQKEMQHSLSIVAQERVASLISAAGTIWYVHEITRDWTRLAFLVPATGPTQLIGVATLLWLCAKYRRASAKQSLSTITETN